MKVQCEKCASEYNIDEARIPAEGLQIKCPRCMAVFLVTRGAQPATAGDLFDLAEEPGLPPPPVAGGKDDLELDLGGEELPQAGSAFSQGPSSSSLPPIGGGSSLPPIGRGSSLPPIGGGAASRAPAPPAAGGGGAFDMPQDLSDEPMPELDVPQPTPGAEGQIFDFIDHEIGSEDDAAKDAPADVRYRIRRKSGKVFGPFDTATVKKMLGEHQLMGNEEASVDGRTFKPLGAYGEFAEVIRQLMDEPVVAAPGEAGNLAGLEDDAAVIGGSLAPKGVEFADAPALTKPKRGGGPGAGLFLVLGLVALVVLAGVGLGFTKYGFFGLKLITGKGGGGGGGGGGSDVVDESRMHFFEDTWAGYTSVVSILDPRARAEDASQDDLSILGLSYAALLRNYGANAEYVKRLGEVLEQLREEAPGSADVTRVEAAQLILADPVQASARLQPLLGEKSRDKEALYLAGWAAAYQKNWRDAATFFDQATVIDPDFAKAFHAMGDIQSLQGDFDSAAAFYDKALEKNPRHVNSAVEQARIAIEVKQDFPQGEGLLGVVFGKHFESLAPGERAKAHHLRAQLYMKQRARDKVVQELNAAIKLVPSRVEYLAFLGNFYLEMGEFGKAKEIFENALAQEPKNLEALLGKGRALWQNGDIVQSKILFEQVAQGEPSDPRPIYFLGRVSEDLERPDEAEKLYQKAAELAPNYLMARVSLARLLLKQGKLADAMDQLSQASKVNPNSALVRNGLGEVYLEQKNIRLAETEFREALKLDPELASAHFNLARALRDSGRIPESLEEFEKVAGISPRYPDLALEQGWSLYQSKRYPDALKMYEAAIRDNPKDDRLYVRAGLSAKAGKDAQAALKHFQMAAGLNPRNAEALFQLALIFQEQKDHEQALDLLRKAGELEKERAETHFHMGLSLMATELVTDAIDEFRTAIRLKPDYVEALLFLGRALAERQLQTEAIQYFNQVLKVQPDRVDVLLDLGDCHTQLNNYAKALIAYKGAVTKNPRAKQAAYRLARTYDELNRKADAIKYYLLAARQEPDDAMPHYYLGYIYKAQGKNKQAKAEFRRYLELRPDAPDADEVREEIEYLRGG
ncbi:MAG TPA: tetratricopeptide repeat protein [Myxococcota bacterium]|nr:tetratricopeptide repeat protein [Myxococcota bacterium]HRY93192.1 tetratricopeptide repeat protein [Myxococcota bacterium]